MTGTFLMVLAQAPAPAPAPSVGEQFTQMLPMFVLIVVIFYFVIYRPQKQQREKHQARLRSASMISRSVGKRPSCFLLKICWLSTETMKMPPLPRTISLSKPSSFLISAARLEARGR